MTTTMNSGHSENVKGPHKGPVTQAAESFFESIRVRQGKQVGVTTGFAVALEACMRKAMKGDLRALAQIMEFIDLEHTPKNLLIRAIRRTRLDDSQKAALESYRNFKRCLNIDPSLERRFRNEIFTKESTEGQKEEIK